MREEIDKILYDFAIDVAKADKNTKHWLFGASADAFAYKYEQGTVKAKRRLKTLITTSNKALLRRVRERGPKPRNLRAARKTYDNGEMDWTQLMVESAYAQAYKEWHQALNEEESLL